MNEPIYAKGLRTFAKNEKAPEFVLGSLVITMNELIAWAKENQQYLTEYNGQKQLKLQLLRKKDGNGINLVVDTFKPEKKAEPVQQQKNEVESDDLPF